MPDQEAPKRLVYSTDRHPVVLRSGRRVRFDPEAPVLELEHGDAHDLCSFGRCSPAETPEAAAERFGLETSDVNDLAKGSRVTTAVHRVTETDGEGEDAESKTVDHTVIVLDRATVSRLRRAAEEQAAAKAEEQAAAKAEAEKKKDEKKAAGEAKAEKSTTKKDQAEG